MDKFLDIVVGIVILFLWVSSIVKKIDKRQKKNKKQPKQEDYPDKGFVDLPEPWRQVIKKDVVLTPELLVSEEKESIICQKEYKEDICTSHIFTQKDFFQELEEEELSLIFSFSESELKKAIIFSEILSKPRAINPISKRW